MQPPANMPALFTARVHGSDAQCDAWEHDTLLDSIEMGGINWPSSCRSGTCRTCMGTLLEGQVRYEMDWPGLTPEEHARGCVLPCVAYPLSDVRLAVGDEPPQS